MQSTHRPHSHASRLDTTASLRAPQRKVIARPARRRSLHALRSCPPACTLKPVAVLALPAASLPLKEDEACDWESWLYAGGDLLMGLPD